MKFTFTSDDVWSNKKITHEFDTDSLITIIENFERFLKANGFEFDGYLDISTPEPEDDLDIEFYDDEEIKTESTIVKKEKCDICHIEKGVMLNHKCFDDKCPKDSW
jgi:cytochrome c peroxidase